MKKVKRNQDLSKLALLIDELVIISVDVHKASYHVAVWSLQRGLLADWVQVAHPQVLLKRIEPIGGHVKQVVYEAGPTGFGLARAAMAAGYAVLVAAPSKIPSLPGRQAKSDRLDAVRGGELAANGQLKPVCVPSEQEEADRQVGRRREQLVAKVRTCKQQIKSFLLNYGLEEPAGLKNWTKAALSELRALELKEALRFCLDDMLDELAFLSERLNKLTAQLRHLSKTERHREAVGRLREHAGVGLITAMTFRLEMPQPERFEHTDEVARYTGLAPGGWISGKTKRGGPILKSGNARIRSVMVEAAWRRIRLDPAARRHWLRLVQNTSSGNKAIVGVARVLAERLWCSLVEAPPAQSQAA